MYSSHANTQFTNTERQQITLYATSPEAEGTGGYTVVVQMLGRIVASWRERANEVRMGVLIGIWLRQ
jgi:hypothetical protein